MGIVSVRRILLCVVLLSTPIFAQVEAEVENKRPAATAPQFEASVGYVYDSVNSASTARVGLSGIDLDGVMRVSPRWAGTLDLTYAHAGKIPGTGYGENMISGMVGPVFYLMQREKTEVFVRGLVGMAWVHSAVPVSPTAYFKGYETRPSFAVGGGMERALSGPFAARISADYQRTSFVDSTLALQGQNNLRVTASLVFRFAYR
jgi:hypothetical protein